MVMVDEFASLILYKRLLETREEVFNGSDVFVIGEDLHHHLFYERVRAGGSAGQDDLHRDFIRKEVLRGQLLVLMKIEMADQFIAQDLIC